MGDDDLRDPVTGLLHRKAFLKEVRDAQQLMPAQLRRGCLLVLNFPVLRSVSRTSDKVDDTEDALCHLLAIVETRVRSRDTIGRISRHSLCILLKGCKEADAVLVADQYAALLHNIVVEVNGQPLPMSLRYRIVPLDSENDRTETRQSVSRLIVAPPLANHATLSKQIEIAGNKVDLSTSKVVSLSDAREDRPESTAGSVESLAGTVLEIGSRDSAHSWRLRPGMLIQRKNLICCFRLQPVGIVRMLDNLQKSDLFSSLLNALSLKDDASRPLMESQFILPVEASQLDMNFPRWVSEQCKRMRVAPSDICLSISVESLSKDLRAIAPVLRLLNQFGIKLMLEGVGSSSQFRMMKSIATFDYLHVSGRTLNDSLLQIAERVQLEGVVQDAREQHCEICAGGVDNEVMMRHALAMNIEIGFGRQCGASVPFPEKAWCNWEALHNS